MSEIESFWGWGWARRFPDDEARLQLGQLVQGLTGFAPRGLLSPPTLAQVELTTPRGPSPAFDFVRSDPEARIRHCYGKSYPDQLRGFRGDYSAAPDRVATPRGEVDIERILEFASASQLAVVPFGGGTSVTGGIECRGEGHAGVLSLDLGHLDRVLEVDPIARLARIQAGAKGPALEAQLGAQGYTLRHFPQSFEHSTLGGWVATRAGGHFATVYTHIDDLVASTRMITPRGLWATRTLPASGAGPAPDRLVLGSEGTLGVITEATVRIRPRPGHRAGATLLYDRFEAGVEAARALAQSGLHPSNCRLLDPREALLFGVNAENKAVLIVGFEAAHHPVEVDLARALELLRDFGGELRPAAVDDGAGRWKQAFFDAPYLQSTLISLGLLADTFETCCTWSTFPTLHAALVKGVREALKRTTGGAFLSCRFTHVYPDGPAPYYTFVGPAPAGGELAAWQEVKHTACEILAQHGATITHHHAVGRTHRPWYRREVPPLFTGALWEVKRHLDPAGIMNPGVLWEIGR